MLEPLNSATAELTVRKSRFLGYGFPVQNPEDAAAAVAGVRQRHPDASHVVHASLTGAPNREIASFSDAGEPKGTAGRPVMEILRGSGIRNMAVVVVRYFGGTKLGTGGLVRAYGDTARAILEATRTRELEIRTELTIETDYTHHDAIRRHLDATGVTILNETFQSDVTIDISVAVSDVAALEQRVQDLSAGRARVHPVSE